MLIMRSIRSATIATIYGALAGALAAVTLWCMNTINHWVWSLSDARWYVPLVIMLGGVLIALIRDETENVDLNAQLTQTHDLLHLKKRRTFFLALSAIIAVGFGGAVGPEAGLVAVVSEASAVVAILIARSKVEARLIGDTGAVAALSGLYGAPPGAAVYTESDSVLGQSSQHRDDESTPLALKFLGAVSGFGGFLLIARWLIPNEGLRLSLPAYIAPRDGSDLLWALIPALLGAGAGVVLRLSRPYITQALNQLGGLRVQTLLGSAAFALLAIVVPAVRFSGHHELVHLLEYGIDVGWPALLGLGLLKALALGLCLSSGWRGGEIFPLLFAGAVLGLVAVVWLPSIPVTVALIAGMTAAAASGMGKPIAVLLIVLLLTGASAPSALFVGILVGYGVMRLLPAHH